MGPLFTVSGQDTQGTLSPRVSLSLVVPQRVCHYQGGGSEEADMQGPHSRKTSPLRRSTLSRGFHGAAIQSLQSPISCWEHTNRRSFPLHRHVCLEEGLSDLLISFQGLQEWAGERSTGDCRKRWLWGMGDVPLTAYGFCHFFLGGKKVTWSLEVKAVRRNLLSRGQLLTVTTWCEVYATRGPLLRWRKNKFRGFSVFPKAMVLQGQCLHNHLLKLMEGPGAL